MSATVLYFFGKDVDINFKAEKSRFFTVTLVEASLMATVMALVLVPLRTRGFSVCSGELPIWPFADLLDGL